MTSALLLPVGVECFAVPLELVREVVAAPLATPLPTAPATVQGLINLRGEIVPLLDTLALATGPRGEAAGYGVVVESSHGLAALAATGLPEVAELGEPVAVAESSACVSVHSVGERLVSLLDIEALVGRVRGAGAG